MTAPSASLRFPFHQASVTKTAALLCKRTGANSLWADSASSHSGMTGYINPLVTVRLQPPGSSTDDTESPGGSPAPHANPAWNEYAAVSDEPREPEMVSANDA